MLSGLEVPGGVKLYYAAALKSVVTGEQPFDGWTENDYSYDFQSLDVGQR